MRVATWAFVCVHNERMSERHPSTLSALHFPAASAARSRAARSRSPSETNHGTPRALAARLHNAPSRALHSPPSPTMRRLLSSIPLYGGAAPAAPAAAAPAAVTLGHLDALRAAQRPIVVLTAQGKARDAREVKAQYGARK